MLAVDGRGLEKLSVFVVPFLLDVLNDSMARHAEFDQVTKLNLVVNSNSDKIMHGNVSPNLILLFWGLVMSRRALM